MSARRPDFVSRGVALEPEPLPTAEDVLPELAMRSFRVVEQEDVIVPSLEIAGSVRRPRLRGIAAVAELGVVALAAPGAGDPQHWCQAQFFLDSPAKAGVQGKRRGAVPLDPRFRGGITMEIWR